MYDYQERLGQSEAFFRELQDLPQHPDYMFNVGKLSDAYRLLQTLVNMSVLERKNNIIEDEEVSVKEPTLNSILEDDNAVEQVKFYGSITEQTELKKLLGKRGRRVPKIEQLQIVKREVRPKYSETLQIDTIKSKLLQAFMEACQMLDPSPTTVLSVFKIVLKKIQVTKYGSQSQSIGNQEKLLSKLVMEIEPTVWFQCATFWLYTVFMNQEDAYNVVLEFCLEQLSQNTNLALYDRQTFVDYLQFIRCVPKITEALKQSFSKMIALIKPQCAIEFWPILLNPENLLYFNDIVQDQILHDLDSNTNPKFNALLIALKNSKILKSEKFQNFAQKKFQASQTVSEVQLYIATHKDIPSAFQNLIDQVSEEFYEIILKEFELPVSDAINYITHDNLLPYLIKQYYHSQKFVDAIVTYADQTKQYNLLVSPVVLLEKLQPISVTMHKKLFSCKDVPLTIHIKYLQGDTAAICALLENNDIQFLKKQVQLCTLAASTNHGLSVLAGLQPCRVWMRLCLLLASVHTQACNQEVKRLLTGEVWQGDKELWDSVRPGLIIFCLKQPILKDVYKDLIPAGILDTMKRESKAFNDLFIQ